MDAYFNVDFFQSLVTTFLGAVLAILAAIGGWWLSGRESRRDTTLRRGQLAEALGQSLEHNLQIAKSASQISDQEVLMVNVDLSVLEATRPLKYDVLRDIDLSRDIDEVGYHLTSLHRLVDLCFELEYSGTMLASSRLSTIRAELNGLIRDRATRAVQHEASEQVVVRLKEMFKTRSTRRASESARGG